LHDDELVCVLPFLSLKDLSRLVRCSRRFHGVVRKERSRELHFRGDATIVPLPFSVLSHHVASLQLEDEFNGNPRITRAVLRRLRDLPRLTALNLTLDDTAAVGYFMRGLSPETAVAALRAVLPTQLRSFSITTGLQMPLDEQSAVLASSFWAALVDMTQLTELTLEQHSRHLHVRPELAGLTHLRKLTLGPAGDRGEHVAEPLAIRHADTGSDGITVRSSVSLLGARRFVFRWEHGVGRWIIAHRRARASSMGCIVQQCAQPAPILRRGRHRNDRSVACCAPFASAAFGGSFAGRLGPS
jgi:hypothetical protein